MEGATRLTSSLQAQSFAGLLTCKNVRSINLRATIEVISSICVNQILLCDSQQLSQGGACVASLHKHTSAFNSCFQEMILPVNGCPCKRCPHPSSGALARHSIAIQQMPFQEMHLSFKRCHVSFYACRSANAEMQNHYSSSSRISHDDQSGCDTTSVSQGHHTSCITRLKNMANQLAAYRLQTLASSTAAETTSQYLEYVLIVGSAVLHSTGGQIGVARSRADIPHHQIRQIQQRCIMACSSNTKVGLCALQWCFVMVLCNGALQWCFARVLSTGALHQNTVHCTLPQAFAA